MKDTLIQEKIHKNFTHLINLVNWERKKGEDLLQYRSCKVGNKQQHLS